MFSKVEVEAEEEEEEEEEELPPRRLPRDFLKTVFATESPMIRTFDKKNLGKRPPPFSYTPSKNLGRRVCVDRV